MHGNGKILTFYWQDATRMDMRFDTCAGRGGRKNGLGTAARFRLRAPAPRLTNREIAIHGVNPLDSVA